MIAAITAGAMIGAGLALAMTWVRHRPTLSAQIARVEGRTPSQGSDAVAGGVLVDHVGAAERFIKTHLGPAADRLIEAPMLADLDLLGRDRHAHVARQVLLMLTAAVLTPLALGVVVAVTGVPWLAGAWAVLVAVAAAYVVPNARARSAAARLRRTFVSTLTAYLDLVSMRVASGSAVPEALRQASHVGTGYGWGRLRGALEDARMDGRSPSAGLAQLGADINISELTELATQLDLVEVTGAQAADTLRTKAEALRARQLAELHGDANARSQSLVLGQVLLGTGFMVLIGYPALHAVMQL